MRWERDSVAMQEALRRHDALMRAAIVEHGGYVFKTVGDAFCTAFSRPQDALSALLAAQSALAAEDFSAVDGVRVRAAIHTGTADERDDDYFGPSVNRVARLLAIGHGGQVLVSGVTSDLVQGTLPPQASLRDLGDHRLKDLARAEHVYQLLAPGLTPDFPPLRSLDLSRNNLPLMLTSFVGREKEVAEISGLLAKHRLVTLVGSGGIGKTRTSLQVAANLIDGSGDGVWFIELAPLASGDYIPATVAQAVGLTIASDGDPIENLARALKTKHALLVFDNCEHLVEPAARVIAALLRAGPKVRILASSRQGLGIAGEVTYRLPSLTMPADAIASHVTATETARYAAVALFVERAQAADHRFALTDENASAVAEICRRLDGIPLAIELAAARVKILSPQQLSNRLDERFQVLTGGGRNVLPRQQTLRALIDWSYDLLDQPERTLFRRLGVFVNGFTLDGAVAVGGDEGLNESEIFDVLASLVDKSLVLAEPDGDVLRYRLLETTRVYAREKLDAAGERGISTDRHLRHLRDRFVEAGSRYESTARWAELDDALATELEDVRAALDAALVGSDALPGAEILAEIGTAWESLALEREGIARIEAFLSAIPEGNSRLHARLRTILVPLLAHAGRTAHAFDVAAEAVTRARQCGRSPILADALGYYAFGAGRLRKFDDAESALGEAEAIDGVSGALRLRLLGVRVFVSGESGDYAAAIRASESLRKAHQTLGNASMDRVAALNLAEIEHARGQTQRAIELVREVLPGFRAHRDRLLLVNVLSNLAGYLTSVDDLLEARAIAREAIVELATREPEAAYIAIAIENLALGFALSGELSRAATLAGYVEPALVKHGFGREFNEMTTHNRLTALLREQLAPDELARLLDEGAELSPEAAIAIAIRP